MNAHPKLSVETAAQSAVFLANRPGALARVCEALANAGINIYALATSDTVDHIVVRMVVSDHTKALMLLGEAGVLALETDVLTIETASEPGVLGKIAERLAEAEVNMNIYLSRRRPRSGKRSDNPAAIGCRKSATCARGALGKSLAPLVGHGRISIVMPSGVTRQSSSISSSVTAMQPAVQSFQR